MVGAQVAATRWKRSRLSHRTTVESTVVRWLNHKQVLWPPGAADTVCPRVQESNFRGLYAAAVDSACPTRLPRLNFVGLPVRYDMNTFRLSINRCGDLDLLTLKLMRVIAYGVSNLVANFGVYGTFYLDLQTKTPVRRITWLCDCDVWLWSLWRYCRWYICISSLKLSCLPIRQIWRTSSISRPGDLDFRPFDLENGVHYCPWGGQHSY